MRNLILLSTLAVMFWGCGPSITTTVKIGNLEVMKEDLGAMSWQYAKKACADVEDGWFGDGWRLPTKSELNILYENRDRIGGFASYNGWSSTEIEGDSAWRQGFGSGTQASNGKVTTVYVRAVRDF